jgi:Skp family chaperone for outer membrane proteins
LYVETQLSEMVTAEARAAAEVSGVTIGEVIVEAARNYYDDGWGGRTHQVALDEAQAEAERRLAGAIHSLHQEQHAQELQQAEAQARAEAEARAAEELARRQAETRQALRQQMQVAMAQAEDRVYHVINRAVGESYRQTLRQLVLNNGGRIISDQQTGSVINLELELY